MTATLAANIACCARMDSPAGPLLLVADDRGLRRIEFVNGRKPVQADPEWRDDAEPLSEVVRQLRAYFAGELKKFDLTLAPEGTPSSSLYGIVCAKSLMEKPFPTASWPAGLVTRTPRARSAWRTVLIRFRL